MSLTDNWTDLTGPSLEQFFRGGSSFLAKHKEIVDDLNVFPVPDGDTGTNMSLTMNSAVKGIQNLGTASLVAHEVSRGALMGARGNSGVILSQLFRGFAQGVGDKRTLNGEDLAHALQSGVELAYKSVMKPVEGTILTVSRAVASGAIGRARETNNIIEILSAALAAGQRALDLTPEQLPVLKQAGVVDAGGKGFLVIIEGGLRALKGEAVELYDVSGSQQASQTGEEASLEKTSALRADAEIDPQKILYKYCTEFIIKGEDLSTGQLKEKYINQGDSLMVVGTEDLIKVHIHTNDPGEILSLALAQGSLHDIKIDNMADQHRKRMEADPQIVTAKSSLENPTDEAQEFCSVVTVVAGEGLQKIFQSLGVKSIINGGQTMNPSAEDLLKAIDQTSSREVVILPNNKNIILAAKQAQSLAEKSVTVVKTKSFAQGLAAMLSFMPELGCQENKKEMTKAFAHVKTGEITYAVRNSNFNGFDIKENDIMGIMEGSIELTGQDVDQVAMELLVKMVDEEQELITLFYGHKVTDEEARALQEKVIAKFPKLEVEIHFGGQPLYYYLISVE